MAKILVAGGLCKEEGDEQSLCNARKRFAVHIGEEVNARGHILLGGCRTTLDAEVALAAAKTALKRGLDPRRYVKSWVTKTTKPIHKHGEIIRSTISDWSQVPRGYAFPEPVREADVVIIVGGWEGTQFAASWARLANKPIVPVAALGGAAAEIFHDETLNFERRYGTRLTMDDYQILDRLLADYSTDTLKTFAKDIVTLAERFIMSKEVFVIMSFADKGDLNDAYDTFCRVCGKPPEFEFHAFKVDEHLDMHQRIIPNIIDAIRRSAFIIADVSEPSTNVYYELGYAQALGKDIILTAREGTKLPFDIYDIPTQYWDSQRTLEKKLHTQISRIAGKFGNIGIIAG